jgi:hypothetical protein
VQRDHDRHHRHHGGEPTWPLVLTNTVVDGGVTWTCQDVANPTGKAHPPAGSFGYVFTSNDLDGFRLLAYNRAKAIATSSRPTTARRATTRRPGSHFEQHADDRGLWDGREGHRQRLQHRHRLVFTCPTGKGGDYDVPGVIWNAFTGPAACSDHLQERHGDQVA